MQICVTSAYCIRRDMVRAGAQVHSTMSIETHDLFMWIRVKLAERERRPPVGAFHNVMRIMNRLMLLFVRVMTNYFLTL